MVVGDLVSLYSAVQKADNKKQRIENAARFDNAVEARIRELLSPNDKYPRGRRTFEAILYALAVFDDDPTELKRHLIRIGAKRIKGNDGKDYWALGGEDNSESGDKHVPDDPTNNSNSIVKWLGILTAIIIAISALLAAVKDLRDKVCEFDNRIFWCKISMDLSADDLGKLDKSYQKLKTANDKKVSDYE